MFQILPQTMERSRVMVTQHENDSSTRIQALRLRAKKSRETIRWDRVLKARKALEDGTLDTPEVWRETLRRFAADC